VRIYLSPLEGGEPRENASSTHSGHAGPRASPGQRRSKCRSAGKPATRALGVAQLSPQTLFISSALALALARSVPKLHLGARSSRARVAKGGPSYVPVVLGPKQSMGFQADRRRHWALARQPLHARVGVRKMAQGSRLSRNHSDAGLGWSTLPMRRARVELKEHINHAYISNGLQYF
jgi:hypothetical protein